jgi:Ca2+-transporting ATPase
MESLPAVGISTDSADKDIMKRKPSKLSEPIINRKQRVTMIIDGILFGLSIAAGYILTYRYTGSEIMAGTVSFAITLLSPQIYVFILREGKLKEKFFRRNHLLKAFFVCTIVMILGIIYIPALNALFTTTPIFDLYVGGIVILFSVLTTLVRAILGENLFFNSRREKQRTKMPVSS